MYSVDDLVRILDNFPLPKARGKEGKVIEIDYEGPLNIYKVRVNGGLYLCFAEEIEKVIPN